MASMCTEDFQRPHCSSCLNHPPFMSLLYRAPKAPSSLSGSNFVEESPTRSSPGTRREQELQSCSPFFGPLKAPCFNRSLLPVNIAAYGYSSFYRYAVDCDARVKRLDEEPDQRGGDAGTVDCILFVRVMATCWAVVHRVLLDVLFLCRALCSRAISFSSSSTLCSFVNRLYDGVKRLVCLLERHPDVF